MTRGSGIKRCETLPQGKPCIRYGEIYTSFDIVLDRPRSFVSNEVYDKALHIKRGDLVFTLTGENQEEIGKTLAYLGDEEIAAGGDLAVWSNHGCDPMYLAYLMYSPKMLKAKADASNGNIIVHLSVKKVQQIEVVLPPLSTQREIVARLEKELGEADKLAAKFKRVAELADDAFKAELDETFKALEDNSRGDAETRRVRLGDVCKVLTDGDWIESKDQSETGIRLIQTGNVGNGVFERKDNRARYISVATFAKLNCTEIYCGDILISRLPEPVGRACIVEDVGCRMITAVDCSIVRFKDTIEPKFFIHYSQSSKYRSQISSQLTGTTRARISRKHLSSVLIACPPISTQRAIVAKLDAAKERCEKLKAAAMRGLAAAENLRKAILAEAFEQ